MVRLLKLVTDQGKRQEDRQTKLMNALINYEAKIGGQLFGPIPSDRRREFFCLDEYTWVWHEEWKDATGNPQVMTTRFLVRPSGIVKSQNGQPYVMLSPAEEQNFFSAVDMYKQRVMPELDRLLQTV